jgi:hypothetical protein
MREFYPFRFFDPLRRKWIRARYLAERATIIDRYTEWEITGPPELRGDDPAPLHSTPPIGLPPT